MGENISTRVAYGLALEEFGDRDNVYVFDADLKSCTMTQYFSEKYPERFFNIGIAEANMVDIAAGFATCGAVSLVHTFAVFAAGRTYDQIRNSVAYPGLNVKIIGSLPDTKGKLLVADQSSCFLSEPVDVTKYGLIFAGAQKNVGPAGTVIVIVREDLVTEDVLPGTPTMLRYKTHADAESLYNTPPTYGIYMCGKVFKWLKARGGLEAMKEYNEKKAEILYNFLDESQLFKGTVVKKDRSLMNVPFVTGDEELDALFVKESKAAGFENLKGHRTVGGMRASIYNAMPAEGVGKLVEFMADFEKKHRK